EIDLVVERSLVDIRQKHGEHAVAAPLAAPPVGGDADGSVSLSAVRELRQNAVRVVVVVHCQADLLQVVAALGAAGGLSCLLDGRQQQRNQDRDDRDHHEQFNQRRSEEHTSEL